MMFLKISTRMCVCVSVCGCVRACVRVCVCVCVCVRARVYTPGSQLLLGRFYPDRCVFVLVRIFDFLKIVFGFFLIIGSRHLRGLLP